MPTPLAGDQENSFAPQMIFLGLRPGGWANYVQFQAPDKIPITFDRIDDIKIDIITRKGEHVNFINGNDVKVQLEFEKII